MESIAKKGENIIMELQNKYLLPVGNFVNGITMPAQISRARTKIVTKLQENIDILMEDDKKLIESHNGTINDDKVYFDNPDEQSEYLSDKNELMNEIININIDNLSSYDKFKNFISEWNGNVSGEDAESFDVLCDALGL